MPRNIGHVPISNKTIIAVLLLSTSIFLLHTAPSERLHFRSSGINVMVLIGTRPELVKMAPVIHELRRQPAFSCSVVSTGQHRDMLEQLLDIFQLSGAINASLDLMVHDQTLPKLSSRVLLAMSRIFELYRPHMLLVQGDTTSALIGALTAFYFKIPVGHIEAGLRTNNIYSPFPEEANRQLISSLASIHFATTQQASKNLLREGKNASRVFITGNTVVDALHRFETWSQANEEEEWQKDIKKKCEPTICRIILLTAHRRENHGEPLSRIMKAVLKLLDVFSDVVVVYPVHMNPNVQKVVGSTVHNERLVLLKPLPYHKLIALMNQSSLILTDSGGIQEEGAVLGKPILILRENTERPEGLAVGIAKLTGTDITSIVQSASAILSGPKTSYSAAARLIYGDGFAAAKITDVISWYFKARNTPPPIPSVQTSSNFDLVVVLTVWKRQTLARYMNMMHAQTIFKYLTAEIIVFQNGMHLNVAQEVSDWRPKFASLGVKLSHVHWRISTGYYGRFAAPLLSSVRRDGYFVICDDDILFGSGYLANMLRLVDKGYLAVRNGRFITSAGDESPGSSSNGWSEGVQATSENDIVYDFGGHMWAGKFEWLQELWKHPPPSLITSEDFWISATLKAHLNVSTARPRCPSSDLQSCACSMRLAHDHRPMELGSIVGGEESRGDAIRAIMKSVESFMRASDASHQAEKSAYTFHKPGFGPFNVSGTYFEQCLFWT